MAASNTPVSQLCFGAGTSELNLRAVSFLYATSVFPTSVARHAALWRQKTVEIPL